MCEVLIWIVDKTMTDPALNAIQYKAGDIIHVAPDGWGWGSEELINPAWRIVKLPGVAESLFADMMERDVISDRIARRRKKFLDFKSDAAILDWLTTKGQVVTLNTKNLRDKFQALKVVKPAAQVVIG